MPVEVILPKVDMDMEAGVVAVWHIAAGETVGKGDPLFDIETSKAAMEVEAPASGILHHPVAAGTRVAVGQPVGWLYAEGERVSETPPPPATASVTNSPAAPVAEPSVPTHEPSNSPVAPSVAGGVRATPAARRAARDGGIDLTTLRGSGPRGRIQRDDVVQPVTAPAVIGWVEGSGPLLVSKGGKGDGLPLLLIHGFAADSTGWMLLERALPGGRPIYRLDLPSHGRSPLRRAPRIERSPSPHGPTARDP